jgi:hypothetical protein
VSQQQPKMSDFQQRMLQAGEDVYTAIERGEITDVEAALMDAHLDASTEGSDD